MKKHLLLTTFLSLALSAYAAEFDWNIGAQGRSAPSLGGNAFTTLGLNQAIWGEISKDKVNYGMLRLQTELASSKVVSHMDTKLLFYPISFLAIGVGHKSVISDYDEFTFYDCTKVRCKGDMKKDYALGKVVLAYSHFIASYKYTFSRNQYNDPDNQGLAVAEFEHTTLVADEYETASEQFYLFGMKHGKNILGLLANHVKYNVSGQDYFSHFLIYNMKLEESKLTMGGGNLYSTHQKPVPIFILRYSFSILPNNALF